MSHAWAIYRDEIVFDDDFLAEVLDEIACRGATGPQPTPIPAGGTLVLGARAFRLERDFGPGVPDATLARYDWVFLADELDLGGHEVDLSAEPGGPGPTGKVGPDEVEAGTTGGEGDTGGAGGKGGDAGSLTVFCERLKGAPGSSITLRGGAGGVGGQGGRGGQGGPKGGEFRTGGRGGRGGLGGPGGSGGAGGVVSLSFVEDAVVGGAGSIIDVAGGAGGSPGPGGPAGAGRDGGDPGQRGLAGTQSGAVGATTAPQLRQAASAEELWARELRRSPNADAADEWSSHRTRIGEYRFRQYKPGEETSEALAAAAATEFEAAGLLDPNNQRSRALRQALVERSTPIGFPREYDLIPDFRRYESVVADYLPVVATLFLSAQILLENAADLERVRDEVDAQKARLEGSIAVLTIEASRADLGLAAARLEVRKADERLSAVQQRIEERRRELEDAEWSALFESVFELAVVLVIFGTTGVPLPFSAPAPYAAFGITALKAAGETASFAETDFRNEKVSDDVEGEAGGLDKLKEGLPGPVKGIFVSAVAVFDDIDAASADPESKALIREVATLAFERQAAALRERQAALEVAAADLELALARADLARIAILRDRLATDTMALGDLVRGVIRRTQGYVDVIVKYIFFAGRALQLYSLADTLTGISFDYGHVDPDLENDAFRSLSRPRDLRGGSTKALRLLEAYLASWQRLPDILVLRDRFESYAASGQVAHDVQIVSIADAASLKLFRQANELSFALDLVSLPPSRYEDKVESVFLALVGATAENPGVTCTLEHGGSWTSRRRNGTETTMRLSPRRTTVLGATSRREHDWLTFQRERTDAGFYGRGAATTWRLSLEGHEVVTNSVDLTGLSEILVGVAYRSFLQ